MSLQHLVSLYQYALAPLAPLAWFGLQVSSLDVFAAFRLCHLLRHLREDLKDEHARTDGKRAAAEDRSFTRDALAVLTVVYGGEAIAAPLLGVPASFMVSGAGPLLYIAAHALVDALPAAGVLPRPSPTAELSLSFLDAHTRAVLVCTLAPPLVLHSLAPGVSGSPWALLLASFLITNGGVFIANLASLHHPTPLALSTPAELRPYGWTTTDLWSAPLVTGIYATLTHAQPFWADVHAVLVRALGQGGGVPEPLDAETARAARALVLAVLFASRTANKFGWVYKRGAVEKIKVN